MVATLPILKDRYKIEKKIAAGGMGIVYAATDERLDRPVAVKILDERLADDPSFVERFRREARAVAALAHPNIARVFDYAEDEGRHFIVMELLEGHDLSHVLRTETSLPPERVARIGAQICAALDHAHSAGIVHRDMKPANVIIEDDDRVKVTDFGIARAMGDAKLTVTGTVMGSVHYISPEQAGGEPVGPASDLYSTGIMIYEMLTGTVPFAGESLMAVAARHLTDTVPPPSNADPELARWDELVARATARDPRRRYPDAAALEAALLDLDRSGAGTAAAGATVPLGAPGSTAVLDVAEQPHTVWPIPGDRWDPHRLGRIVLVVFALLAVVAAALLMVRLAGSESPRRSPTGTEQTATGGGFTMPTEEEIVGANYLRVAGALEDNGVPYVVEGVDPDDYGLDLPEGAIVTTEPPPGSEVEAGETITLFVSSGDDEGPPSDNGKGKGKGKDKGKGND